MKRRVFTEAAFEVDIGQEVGDVTWTQSIPGSKYRVLSRGYGKFGPGPAGLWLLLTTSPLT